MTFLAGLLLGFIIGVIVYAIMVVQMSRTYDLSLLANSAPNVSPTIGLGKRVSSLTIVCLGGCNTSSGL